MVRLAICVHRLTKQANKKDFYISQNGNVNYTFSIMKFEVVDVSGSRFGVCAPGSCESMRGRKGRLLCGKHMVNFNFPPAYVGGRFW